MFPPLEMLLVHRPLADNCQQPQPSPQKLSMQLRALLPVLGSRLRHRPGPVLALIASGALLAGAAPSAGNVSVTVTGLRSAKGQILACLTARPDAFPNCGKDPRARKLIVPANGTLWLDFGQVPHGAYAIALVHDENGNGQLDKRLIIPREGFGFSRESDRQSTRLNSSH